MNGKRTRCLIKLLVTLLMMVTVLLSTTHVWALTLDTNSYVHYRSLDREDWIG